MLEEELFFNLKRLVEFELEELGFLFVREPLCDEGLVFKNTEGLCLAFSWDSRDQRLTIKFGYLYRMINDHKIQVVPTLLNDVVHQCGGNNFIPDVAKFDSFESYLSSLSEELIATIKHITNTTSPSKLKELDAVSLSFYKGAFENVESC